MDKKDIYFTNQDGVYGVGDVAKKEVRLSGTVTPGVVITVKLDHINWLVDQLRKCQHKFTEILDSEEYYKTILEEMNTGGLVAIYNELKAGNEFIPTTEEFLSNYLGINKCNRLSEFIEKLENYDLSDICDLLDSDWVTEETVNCNPPKKYLEPWYYGDGNTDRYLIENIVKVLIDYSYNQLDELNNRLGTNIKHYSVYVKEEQAKLENE